LKLVYFGTGAFALPTLRALAEHVSLVVTQPDRPSGRGHKLQPSAAKFLAEELGIPGESPEKTRSPEFVERLQSEEADALVVASYGQILSQKVLDSAKFGGINLHGSILPKYRGAAPIQRSIFEGEAETGITLMQMDKGMDTGDMITVVRTAIGADETYGELQDRLAIIAADLAREWMPRIVRGDYVRIPQNSEEATLAPKIDRTETELDPQRDARDEYNRFRAFTPAPGAFLASAYGRLRLSEVRLSDMSGEPGTILSTKPLTIAFSNGSLILNEIQPEGKKKQTGRDFANGARLVAGMRLHS
jgi:methionyl-tRNA formyltransferase